MTTQDTDPQSGNKPNYWLRRAVVAGVGLAAVGGAPVLVDGVVHLGKDIVQNIAQERINNDPTHRIAPGDRVYVQARKGDTAIKVANRVAADNPDAWEDVEAQVEAQAEGQPGGLQPGQEVVVDQKDVMPINPELDAELSHADQLEQGQPPTGR